MNYPTKEAINERISLAPVYQMFHRFMNKLDRQSALERSTRLIDKLNAKHFALLHDPEHPGDDDLLWNQLKTCAQWGLIELEKKRQRTLHVEAPWLNYQVIFNNEAEACVRDWLDRPQENPRQKAWQQALSAHPHAFVDRELLNKPVLQSYGYSDQDLFDRLTRIPALLHQYPNSTCYQISSYLFDAHSKVLAGKEAWLERLFGWEEGTIRRRPLLLDVSFPQADRTPDGILLLENKDSYLAAASGEWAGVDSYFIVYTEGFKAATPRIRAPDNYQIQVMAENYDTDRCRLFKQVWQGNMQLPMYIFGDLDLSGMQIVAGLKRIFPQLLPWRPGYQCLIEQCRQGIGHTAEHAGKINSTELKSTGIPWLDDNALNILKSGAAMVDQEIASFYLKK